MVMEPPVAFGEDSPSRVVDAIRARLQTLLAEDPRFPPEQVARFASLVASVVSALPASATLHYELVARPNLEVRVDDGQHVDLFVLNPPVR